MMEWNSMSTETNGILYEFIRRWLFYPSGLNVILYEPLNSDIYVLHFTGMTLRAFVYISTV
jgi:hypothetical protein